MKSPTFVVSLTVLGLLAGGAAGIADEPNGSGSRPASADLAALQGEHTRLQAAAEQTRRDYELLIESLLKSPDERTVMIGLRHMHKCQSYGFHPYSIAIHNELIKLTYSDNKQIREAAVLSVMRVAPTHAAEHGFQGPGSPWQHVGEGPESERTRQSLDRQIGVEGTFTPKQLEGEFQHYRISVYLGTVAPELKGEY